MRGMVDVIDFYIAGPVKLGAFYRYYAVATGVVIARNNQRGHLSSNFFQRSPVDWFRGLWQSQSLVRADRSFGLGLRRPLEKPPRLMIRLGATIRGA